MIDDAVHQVLDEISGDGLEWGEDEPGERKVLQRDDRLPSENSATH